MPEIHTIESRQELLDEATEWLNNAFKAVGRMQRMCEENDRDLAEVERSIRSAGRRTGDDNDE